MDNLLSIIKSQILFNSDNQAFIRLKVIPKSPKNEFTEIMEDWSIKIKIKAIPEKWKANLEIIKFLKKQFWISSVEIISWKSERIKLVRLVK